jgi:ABC-type Co2+ transport system permease subunit
MVVVAFGSQGAGVALGFMGLVALSFGPWILLAAYLGALLIALLRRATGLPIMGLPLRSCQLAGLVGGSVSYRASRVGSSLSAP